MGNISKSVLASLNRELADLSRSLSHSDTSMAVKQASNALADLPKDLDGYRVSKTLRDLNRELDNFSLPRFDQPSLEIKRSAVGTEVRGYAAVFRTIDAQGEVIDPGAFSEGLAQHRRKGTMPPDVLVAQSGGNSGLLDKHGRRPQRVACDGTDIVNRPAWQGSDCAN